MKAVTSSPVDIEYFAFNGLGVSRSTRADYQARLSSFLQFVTINGISPQSYLYFKQYLAEREDLGVAAKNKYLVSAKAYLKELHRNGVLPLDITANVKAFKQSKKHKKMSITQEEVERLIDWMNVEIDQ